MPEHQDDPSIEDHFRLLRRIPITFEVFIVWNANINAWRISSQAFRDHPTGTPMSVHIQQVLEQLGESIESVLEDHSDFALASVTAGLARELNQIVLRDPRDGQPAHAHVIGKKSKRVQRTFAEHAEWVLPPTSFPDPPSSN